MPVEIAKTEVRDGDELSEGDKYAIYYINVTLDGRETYEVSRRFSQFRELMDQMCKVHAPVKEVPFPPKKILGKLAPSVIEKRATELEVWVNALLGHSDESIKTAESLLYFLEAKEGMVQIGGPAPTHSFADIHGRVFNPAAYGSDWLQIYSVASRDNSGTLTKFMKAAGAAITAKHPSIKQVFCNVADLRPVPDSMQGMVLKILSSLDKNSVSQLLDSYTKDCPGAYNGQDMFFHSDFSGETIAALGCDDCNWTFRVFIVAGGSIVGSFQSSTPDVINAYVAAIDSAVEKFPQVIAPWPAAKDGSASPYGEVKEIANETIKIGPRKMHAVEISISEPALVGWQLQVGGKSNHLEFQIVCKNAPGDDEKTVILPKRKVECGEHPYSQVCHLAAGNYYLELDNTMSTLSSKEVTFCATQSKLMEA